MNQHMNQRRKFSLNTHWTTQELVTVGVFAAVIKASTIMIAFAGGGMNPLTLAIKNCLFVTLMIVLLHKVPKPGTLTLVTFVTALVSLLLMGQGIMHTPGMLISCLVAEFVMWILGGYKKTANIIIGVFVYDIGSKLLGIIISYLSMREQPGLILPVLIFITIGSFGSILGLWCGAKFTKELRHAGIISD